MKNKVQNYFLIAAVAVVWGLIIYRIFSAINASDDMALPVSADTGRKETYNDYAVTKDTTRLLINYRDPFGVVKPPDTLKARRAVTSLHAIEMRPAIPPAINWGFIKYSGYIFNPGSKKMLAMLAINGKNVMMAEGQTAEQVRLLKNMKDSIKISYQGKIKYIGLERN